MSYDDAGMTPAPTDFTRRNFIKGVIASGWQTCAVAMRLVVDHVDGGVDAFQHANETLVGVLERPREAA